ncbi:MAG TPA: ribonuclease HII [Campylobacterales bacterium]|nr:ribonuclease HII [Campylobacterales bacterium]HIP59459.1 ribonuclease HII [Campylobacterales bacterium]
MKICGIDEAGRGCLAGPLVVAGVIFEKSVEGLRDSKKLTEKKREVLFEKIIPNAKYEIVFTDNKTIDEIGLSAALKNSIIQIMTALNPEHTIMDGNTTFGVEGVEAIIKADDKIDEVSAASILAKVSRDRYIVEQASNFPLYQFEKHKGYGTALHRELIKEHGYCELHRRSFKIKSL